MNAVIALAVGLSGSFVMACGYFLRWREPRPNHESELKALRRKHEAALNRIAELEVEVAKRQGAYR